MCTVINTPRVRSDPLPNHKHQTMFGHTSTQSLQDALPERRTQCPSFLKVSEERGRKAAADELVRRGKHVEFVTNEQDEEAMVENERQLQPSTPERELVDLTEPEKPKKRKRPVRKEITIHAELIKERFESIEKQLWRLQAMGRMTMGPESEIITADLALLKKMFVAYAYEEWEEAIGVDLRTPVQTTSSV